MQVYELSPGNELKFPPIASIARFIPSKFSIEHVEENKNKIKFNEQKWLLGRDFFCPNVCLHSSPRVEERMEYFDTEKEPFALRKISQVPDHLKMIEWNFIEHNEVQHNFDCWMSQFSERYLVGWMFEKRHR